MAEATIAVRIRIMGMDERIGGWMKSAGTKPGRGCVPRVPPGTRDENESLARGNVCGLARRRRIGAAGSGEKCGGGGDEGEFHEFD